MKDNSFEIKSHNFNADQFLGLNDLPCGKSLFVIRTHRERYYMEIEKNSVSAFVEIYSYFKDRNSQSKYDQKERCNLLLKSSAYITREMIDNRYDLEKAQDAYRKYGTVLY